LSSAQALFAQALALEDAGRHEEALESYRRVLAQAPAHADAWHNHGLLLARLGRWEEAERSHRSYIEAAPDSPRARADLADVLLATGRYEAAIEALDWILERAPGDAVALLQRGVAFSCLRRFDDARACFTLATTRSPRETHAFLARIAAGADVQYLLSSQNIFLARAAMAHRQCDWSGWTSYVAEMRSAAACGPSVVLDPSIAFMSLHLPLDSRERHAIARSVCARIESQAPLMPPPEAPRSGRIRIGILSPDYREHLNAYLLLPLFELIDRSRFAITAYSLTASDGSPARERIRAAADAFRDLHTLDDDQAARAIRADGTDVLIDAAGHTTGARFGILARRPARIQALYLGFPGSLGSKRVDFAIVDGVVAPDADGWSETLLRLPNTYYLYDFRSDTPELPLSRRDYGLAEDAFVYCAFHKAEKISPDVFAIWMRILRRASGSVLWLAALADAAQANLRREAAKHRVDASRLVFAPLEPRPRYLARHRLADLFLDARYHSAMTTACDALGAGLPLLSLRGTTMAGRAAESLLRAAGLPELVAGNEEAYVATALRLAHDGTRALKERLASARHSAPLFDTPARVRELEACFEAMAGGNGAC
jgi:protein O-GlcNAc transferase